MDSQGSDSERYKRGHHSKIPPRNAKQSKGRETCTLPPVGHARGQVLVSGTVGKRPSLCSETKISCKTCQNKGGLWGGDSVTGPGDEGPSPPSPQLEWDMPPVH